MNSRRELLQVIPTNLGAKNEFSPSRNGLQTVVFQIPKLPRVMIGRTLRINGTFGIFKANDSKSDNANLWLDEAPLDSISIDGRIGVSSCIDSLSIQNLLVATYSNVKNYNRLCSSIVPLNQSFNNYINGCDEEYGQGKQVTQAKRCDKDFDFSLPILDGFLQADPIDMYLTEGLQLTLSLSPDNFVINNTYWRNQQAQTPNGAFYKWSDLVLSVETEVPDEAGQQAMMSNNRGLMTYRTYSSFYSVILSNQYNISMLFNTRNTTALIGNISPSEWINNYQYNSSMTPQLLYKSDATGVLNNNIRVNSFTYQKAGVRTPYDFEIRSEKTQDEGTADSVKNLTEIEAIRDGWDIYNFYKSLETELSNPLTDTKLNKFDRSKYAINYQDKENAYMIGVSYDKLGSGVDFRNQPFSLRLQSELPADQSFQPHSLYLFVQAENQIVFDNGMVNVIS